jgi:hypothetical protein
MGFMGYPWEQEHSGRPTALNYINLVKEGNVNVAPQILCGSLGNK